MPKTRIPTCAGYLRVAWAKIQRDEALRDMEDANA